MHLELLRVVYWVAVYCVISFLPQLGGLAPLGRALFLGGSGPYRGVHRPNAWADAVGACLIWWFAPLFCSAVVENWLTQAGVVLPWIGNAAVGGPAYWWFVGVGMTFGWLYRSSRSMLAAGLVALAWQWMLLGPHFRQILADWPLFAAPANPLLIGVVTGLVVGAADLLASAFAFPVRRVYYRRHHDDDEDDLFDFDD